MQNRIGCFEKMYKMHFVPAKYFDSCGLALSYPDRLK